MEREGVTAEAPQLDIFFAFDDMSKRPLVLPYLARLRKEGLSCDAEYGGRSLRGQRDYAFKRGAKMLLVTYANRAELERKVEENDAVDVVLKELNEVLK
jgi:histidyl-tRNA synthetase